MINRGFMGKTLEIIKLIYRPAMFHCYVRLPKGNSNHLRQGKKQVDHETMTRYLIQLRQMKHVSKHIDSK